MSFCCQSVYIIRMGFGPILAATAIPIKIIVVVPFERTFTTRMHSSRMRTVRCSDRLREVPVQGGLPYGGVCPGGGVCLGVYTGRHPPGPRRRHPFPWTDTCENITFPQLLLRTVIRWCWDEEACTSCMVRQSWRKMPRENYWQVTKVHYKGSNHALKIALTRMIKEVNLT